MIGVARWAPFAAAAMLWLTAAAVAAQPDEAPAALFARTCAQCHAAGGWGTRALAKRVLPGDAELLRRKSIPGEVVTYVVRHGIGSMPQFTPTDISDQQLERLARWLERGRATR